MKPVRHFSVYIEAGFVKGDRGKLYELDRYLVPKEICESGDITEIMRAMNDNFMKFRDDLCKKILEE